MATPQTAVQIQMMMRSCDLAVLKRRDFIEQFYVNPLMDMIVRRIILHRPHTDDMMQMLVDLGIEPPAQNLVGLDGLTIRFRS
jgi:hypothetical protein